VFEDYFKPFVVFFSIENPKMATETQNKDDKSEEAGGSSEEAFDSFYQEVTTFCSTGIHKNIVTRISSVMQTNIFSPMYAPILSKFQTFACLIY
jgi:hypothetical protein